MIFFKRKIWRSFQSNAGSVVVDYLLTTAMVAGVLVPIILKFGGESFKASLFGQRQKMVSFLAQDRKQNVPSSWFSQENPPEVRGDNPNITVTQDISEGDPREPGEISTGGDPRVANLSDPNRDKINSPENISVGNPGGNGSGAGIGTGNTNGTGGSAGGGGSGSGAGNSATSSDFFSGRNGAETTEGATRKTGEASGAYAGSKNGVGESGDEGDDFSEEGGQKGKEKKDGQSQDKSENVADSRRKTQENLRLTEQAVEKRSGQFDWWLLLKILIVALIIFLIALIALSNLKRR